MPNSKHRKKQLATNRRQLERARRKLQLQNAREKECDKENQPLSPQGKGIITTDTTSEKGAEHREPDDGSGWLGSIYSWCSGIAQVRRV